MGNYKFEENSNKNKQLPAGRRGIGCMLAMILPVVSYVAAIGLLDIKEVKTVVYRISPTLFGPPTIPSLIWKIKAIRPFLDLVYSWKDLEANLLLGLFILLILWGVIGSIYSAIYNVVSPSRYGKLDAPPSRRKSTKKSR